MGLHREGVQESPEQLRAGGVARDAGRLDPEAAGRTSVLLVNISSRAVQAVPVDFHADEFEPEAYAAEASRIVEGGEGVAQVGPLCRVCEFRGICPAGTEYVGE